MKQSSPRAQGTKSKHLPVVSLARHPKGARPLASPYPMGKRTRRAFAGIIRAVVPPAPAPKLADAETLIASIIRSWMPYMHPLAARGLWLSIWLIEWAPRFLFISTRRFSDLPAERGSRLLSEMVHGRYSFLRLLVVALRGVIMSSYFDQDVVHRALGYAPVPFMRSRIQERARRLETARPEPKPLHPSALAAASKARVDSVPPPAFGGQP